MFNFSHLNGDFAVKGSKLISPEEKPLNFRKRLYNHYFNQFSQIVMSLFEWENLPDSMDERALELSLFTNGMACFYYDDETGKYLNLNASPSESLNIYDNPTQLVIFGFNGVYNKTVSIDNAVFIRNNIFGTPSYETVDLFTQFVVKCEQTKLINLNTLKTPYLFRINKKLEKTFKEFYDQLEADKPMILLDEDLITEQTCQVLNANVQYFCDKIEENKRSYIGEFLSYYGINNIDFEKKERLIVDEANANNERLTYNILSMLRPRLKACEEFNKKYKTDLEKNGLKPINVKLSENAIKIINSENEEVEENGE